MAGMPMVRCPECDVRQYAATPYVTPAECVSCGRPLLPRRSGSIDAGGERAYAAGHRPGEVEKSTSRSGTRA
jgi:hypothetical protein